MNNTVIVNDEWFNLEKQSTCKFYDDDYPVLEFNLGLPSFFLVGGAPAAALWHHMKKHAYVIEGECFDG